MQKCVFIIDDDPIIRYFLRLLIERKTDFEVYDFDSGFAAIRMLHKNPFLIISDYEMDTMNGIQVIKRVRELMPEMNMCLISSLKDVHLIQQADELGVEFFHKDERLNQRILNKISVVSTIVA